MFHRFQLIKSLMILMVITISSFLLFYSTKWGIGTSPDSASYIGVASNLLSGKGLTVPYGNPPDQPLTFYPPLYPIFLSLGGILGDPILQSSRWLHAILISANLFLFWLFLRKLTPSSMPSLSTILLIPLAISPLFINIHIMAWSEGLFLLMGFAGLFLVAKGLSKEQKRLVFSGGILLGLASLTRYSGLALIVTVTAAIFLFHEGKVRKKVIYTIYAALPGLILITFWAMWTFVSSGNIASRSFDFHLIGIKQLQQGLDTIANWFLIPLRLPGILKLGILASIIIPLMVILLKGLNKFTPEAKWIITILATFSVSYTIFLVVSISFIDANTPLDDRILSPFFVTLWLLMAAGIGQFLSVLRSTPTRKILIVSLVVIVFCGVVFTKQITIFQSNHVFGVGFSQLKWRESKLINELEQLHPDLVIYTNSPEAVYLLTGKSSIPLPRKVDLTRQKPYTNFQESIEQLSKEISKGNAVIAYFSSIQSGAIPNIIEMKLLFTSPIKTIEYADGTLMGGSH